MRRYSARTLRCQRGVAAVEFAITAILLVMIIFGVSQLGRATYQYNTVAKNTRAAARYLAQFASGDATATAAAKCLVVYGRTTCGGTALVPGLTTAMVTVCDASVPACAATHALQQTGFGLINLVTVTVSGLQFRSMATGYVPNFTLSPIHATMPQGS